MMKKLLAISTMTIAVASAVAGEYWNVESGGTTMKFLSMHVSPRAAALSGAGVADPGRVSEVTRNPLAMGVADAPEFGLSQIIFDGAGADNFTSVYYGHPIGDYLVVSGAIDFLGYDDIEGRDENGLKTSDYAAYAWSLQAGVGNRSNVFNWALTTRFATQTIDDETAYAFLADIGGSYRVNEYLAFGATLTNAGFVSQYVDVDEYAPMALQAGLTGMVPISEKWDVHVSADAYRRADTDPQWLFGSEVSYAKTLMLRVGYALRTDNDTENGISCGLGVSFGMIIFDYGYSPRKAFEGGNHYIALGLKF